jgi:hypothetical protein
VLAASTLRVGVHGSGARHRADCMGRTRQTRKVLGRLTVEAWQDDSHWPPNLAFGKLSGGLGEIKMSKTLSVAVDQMGRLTGRPLNCRQWLASTTPPASAVHTLNR